MGHETGGAGAFSGVLRPRVRLGAPGMTLIEVTVLIAILAIALTGAMGLYISHLRGGRLTEERRAMAQWALEILDEIQIEVADGKSLSDVFQAYDDSTRSGATLPAGIKLLSESAVATVKIIDDETPSEAQFDVDIDGKGNVTDFNPPPFPLDLNRDGDTADDQVDKDKMKMLPAVVTVKWTGPFGPQRIDVFTIVVQGGQ